MTNCSNRVVTLQYGTPIARLFLYRLTSSVEQPYATGTAMGIAQQLESVPASSVLTSEDARSAPERVLLEEINRIPISGLHVSEALSRQKRQLERLSVFLFLWPIALFGFLNNSWIKQLIHSDFVRGVVASMVAWALSWFLEFSVKQLRD
ncbi:MAG: hypothetical protein H0X25_19715 [Acidobacteriales bacterium]|nr:hypothetical protein [Terriglobales bacterium]